MKRGKVAEAARRDGAGLVLLLSIRREHVDRIFSGSKHFELRRVLPAAPLKRVYLYETGGTGVVGCFDVAAVLHQSVERLWRAVGVSATTRDRFKRYFANAKEGFAIAIENPLRFARPLNLRDLQIDHPTLTAPQSYIIVAPGHSVFGLLENARREAIRSAPPSVLLRSIARSERAQYELLVKKYIGAHYDEIDASFARRNLKVHDLGFDPAGFFTRRKEVLAIENAAGRCIGFTTLTYKSGDAVKTGPTILFARYRHRGYGLSTRRAIETRVRSAGARKVYCTAPDTALDTVRYLLSAGMRVEAHLERHYSTAHDELVFGKFVLADDSRPSDRPRLPEVPARLAEPDTFSRSVLVNDFLSMFEAVWHPVKRRYVQRIVTQTLDEGPGRAADKPKRLVCLRRGKRCVGAIVLLPKRGGAVKGLLLRRTSHSRSTLALLESAVMLATTMGGRKLYFLHPLDDAPATSLLRRSGFEVEGVLAAPYVPGQDVLVLSRML